MAKKPKNPIQPEPLAAAKKPAKPKVAKKAEPTAKAEPAAPRPKVKAAAVTKPGSSKVKITAADVALRAYFIAEARYKQGIPGDSTSDWVEAERQLKAEASIKPIL